MVRYLLKSCAEHLRFFELHFFGGFVQGPGTPHEYLILNIQGPEPRSLLVPLFLLIDIARSQVNSFNNKPRRQAQGETCFTYMAYFT